MLLCSPMVGKFRGLKVIAYIEGKNMARNLLCLGCQGNKNACGPFTSVENLLFLGHPKF